MHLKLRQVNFDYFLACQIFKTILLYKIISEALHLKLWIQEVRLSKKGGKIVGTERTPNIELFLLCRKTKFSIYLTLSFFFQVE